MIAALAAAGCVLLLFDHAQHDAAAAFHYAAECADTSSDHCYQLRPGVIQSVRRARTGSGEQDVVVISSLDSNVRTSLLPSPSDAPLLQAGTAVTIEWYEGSVVTVWIAGQMIPSTANLAAGHAEFAFVGWILIWLAALFAAIVIVNRRMARVLAAVRVLPTGSAVDSAATRQVILPDGATGWVIRPRATELLLLPLALVVLAVISVRPFMNADVRPLAATGDLVVLGAVLSRLALTFRNNRLTLSQVSIRFTDWLGRVHTWPRNDVSHVSVAGTRWTDWTIPALVFVDRAESPIFHLTSLFWNLEEISACCLRIGLPLSIGFSTTGSNWRPWRRRILGAAVTGLSLALLVVSFLPPAATGR